MGAEAETNKAATATVVVTPFADGKVSDTAGAKISTGLDAALKPAAAGGGAGDPVKAPNNERGLTDDEIAATLAAASVKLQAAQRRDAKKSKKGVAGCLGALYPKKLLSRLRDCYINSCVIAAEKGDFVDLVAGNHAYYGETAMSRNMSQRREREHEEMLNASLSRQVSISLSRQLSQTKQAQPGQATMLRNTSNGIQGLNRSASAGIPALSRNASTGIPGLPRQTSTGIAGLNRQPSTGIVGLNRHTGVSRNTFGRSMSSKKKADSNLFAGGRDKFLQDLSGSDFSSTQKNSNPKK